MSTMADKFEELGVIPVVVLNDVKDALPLAKALYEGGLPCAESNIPYSSSRGIYPCYA